jgi:tripartite-type tricarboxylate transporter receptor subunit TctC
MASVPNALSVNPQKIPQNTLAEFIAAAKASPGKITSATQGNGTTSHLTSEMFQMMAGVKFQHVPYRGSAPALQDLVAGSVDVMFDNLGSSLALIKGGQLKLIAVAAPKRMKALPNVPAIAETLPGFEATAWFGVVAPPKTPPGIIKKINADINEVLKMPEVIARLDAIAAETVGGTPEQTATYMHEEVERWRKVIKAANVTLN